MICSTGAIARPSKIEAAIIIPAVTSPRITKNAANPKTKDCTEIRTSFVNELMREAFWLASACKRKKSRCCSNQRLRILGSIPIASITSALRKLLVAILEERIAVTLASANGLRETNSLIHAKAIMMTVLTNANMPSQKWNMKITNK